MHTEISLLESIKGTETLLQYKVNNTSDQFDAKITIPAGVPHGATIQYPGLGDHTHKNLPRGDLLLTIYIRPHPIFEQRGPHLVTKFTVPVWTTILGGTFDFTTIEDTILNVNVPAGTQPGTVFRLAEHGGTDASTQKRGDCYIELGVVIPTLTDDQKEQIARLV